MEVLEDFVDDKSMLSNLPWDIKKLLVPLIDTLITPGIKDIVALEEICKTTPHLNSLLCDNYDYWKLLWTYYVSDEIPEGNINILKEKYKKAMRLYNFKTIKGDDHHNYDYFMGDFNDDEINEALEYRKKLLKKLKYNRMAEILALNENWGSVNNDKKSISNYIKLGADINNFVDISDSPLYRSLRSKRYRDNTLVDFLIEQGADFGASALSNRKDRYATGVTPFTNLSNLEVISYALSKGADINLKGSDQETLLHHIIYKIVRPKANYDPDNDVYEEDSLKHIYPNTSKAIEFLIQNGADPTIEVYNENLFHFIRKFNISKNDKTYLFKILRNDKSLDFDIYK